jgi:hypothetical protein
MFNISYYCDIFPNTSLFGRDKHCIVYISCLQYWRTPHWSVALIGKPSRQSYNQHIHLS